MTKVASTVGPALSVNKSEGKKTRHVAEAFIRGFIERLIHSRTFANELGYWRSRTYVNVLGYLAWMFFLSSVRSKHLQLQC